VGHARLLKLLHRAQLILLSKPLLIALILHDPLLPRVRLPLPNLLPLLRELENLRGSVQLYGAPGRRGADTPPATALLTQSVTRERN
jgi:hypothetical protein